MLSTGWSYSNWSALMAMFSQFNYPMTFSPLFTSLLSFLWSLLQTPAGDGVSTQAPLTSLLHS